LPLTELLVLKVNATASLSNHKGLRGSQDPRNNTTRMIGPHDTSLTPEQMRQVSCALGEPSPGHGRAPM